METEEEKLGYCLKFLLKLRLIVGITTILLCSQISALAQYIYFEDFSLPPGTTVDTGDSPWTRDISGTNLGLPDDHFEVRDNNGSGLLIFQAVDTDGVAIWSSGVVDISGFSEATVSVDIAEAGNMENNDFIRIFYRLDGGPEVRFANFRNDFGATFQTVTSPAVSGSTLQVVVRVRNNGDDELHAFDNVGISGPGTGTLFARQNDSWNSLEAWSFTGPSGVSCDCFPDANTTAVIGSGNTIEVSSFSSVNNLTIENTGSLVWSADTELNVFNEGTLDIQAGGVLDMTGFNLSQLDMAESTGNFDLIVDGTLIANDIDLNGVDSFLDISGTGSINVLKDLRFDFTRITVNNNFDGQFTLQGDILFAANRGLINNNGKLEVIGDIQFFSDLGDIFNQAINNSDTLIANDIIVQETQNTIDNLAGAFFNFQNINVSAGFDIEIDNRGVIQMDGDFVSSTTTSQFINRTGSEWRFLGTGIATDVILDADEVGNTFIYQGGGQQIINPQDGYYDLVLSNTGAKAALTGLTIARNISINDNSQLDLVSNGADILLGGDFINNGTSPDPLLSTGRTITFNGNTDQTVDSRNADFYNIRLNKTGGDLNIISQLNLNAGLGFISVTNVNSNGNLRLVSISDNNDIDNGRILTIPNGASVNGDVTVERFMSGEGSIYRYIASPIQNATVASWQDDVSITGPFSDPSSGPGVIRSSASSLFFYDEAPFGDLLTGWTAYPTSGAAADNPLVPGLGYALFAYDGGNPITLDVTGPVNQGTFDLPVSYTDSGDPTEDGWTLVANPYPCTIDWDNAGGWVRTGLANATYVRDNTVGAGVFATYVDGVGINNGTSRIALGQAFWVQSLSTNPQLQVNELAKADEGRVFFGVESPKSYIRLSLSDGEIDDEAVIRFKPSASMGFDPDEDATKRSNSTFNLASYDQDSLIMAINALPDINCDMEVGLFIQYLSKGPYKLFLEDLVNIDANFTIHLKDHYLDSIFDFKAYSEYEFEVTNNPLSSDSKRFSLTLERQNPFNYPLNEATICAGDEIKLPLLEGFTDYSLFHNGDSLEYTLNGNVITLASDSLNSGDLITLSAYSSECGSENQAEITVNIEEIPEVSEIFVKTDCRDNVALVTMEITSDFSNISVYRSIVSDQIIAKSDTSTFTFTDSEWQATYYLAVENELACESVRYPFNVSFPTLKPEILQVNDTTLMANYVQGIQWYKDGEIITNATSEVLVVQGSGVYGLSVEQSGCIEFAEIDITIASENEGEELVTSVDPSLLEGGAEFVYPNPTSRYLNIPFENLQIEQIQIIDSRGVTVYSINNLASEDSFYLKVDLVDIPGGLYSAIVTGKETQKTYQFIKN